MNEYEAWRQRLALLNRTLPDLLSSSSGKTVLYVGATPWRFQMGRELFEAGHEVTLLEAHKPFADHYRDHPWLAAVIHGDVRRIAEIAQGQKWDVVVWWHGPEHVQEDELARTLEDLEFVANELVLLGCPWGVNRHGVVTGNPYSRHEAHLGKSDLEELGYTVKTLGEKDNPLTWCHMQSWKWIGVPETVASGTVVYTAIFGDYDELLPAFTDDVPHVCFTDGEIEADGWEVRKVSRRCRDPRMEARIYKALAHQWLPDVETSIWIDGCLKLNVHPREFAAHLGENDIAVLSHPERDCTYEEAVAVLRLGKATKTAVDEQMDRYQCEEYPVNHGMVATTLVVRRHTSETAEFNNAWWSEISRYTLRDQLSFCYVGWKLGIDYSIIQANLWADDRFSWRGHEKNDAEMNRG